MTEQYIKSITENSGDMFTQAELMHKLCLEYGYTQSRLAKQLHVSQSSIGNKIRLLQYSQQEREQILFYRLTERHARALLRVLPPKRAKLIKTTGEMHLTVQQTEELVDKYRGDTMPTAPDSDFERQIADIDSFTDHITTATNKLRNFGYHVSYLTESGERWQRITIIVRE